ncbi:hypothetical protein Tco_0462961 [Tanacetum coccineum]
MHTSKDDYLISTLRFVSRKKASQIYGAILPECLTSPEMKESKAYKTYLGYATGEVLPKGKRLKTPAKKSASKPATSIVIREPHVETKSKRKEKEKADVTHGKGIKLLPEVALSKKAQMKEVRKKSLRDFHKTRPSGSGTVAEKPPSIEKITPIVISKGTGDKPGVLDVTNDDSSESESESWGNDEDDSNNEQESSDESSKQENESEEQESDSEQDEEFDDDEQEEEEFDQENESEDDEMKRIVQGEGNDTEMTEAQQGNENLETTQEQVVEDAHVTIFTVLKKTEVPVTSSSRSSDLASKFLIFLDIPQTDAKIVSPLDVYVHHEVPRTQAPTLLTIPVSVIPESSPSFDSTIELQHWKKKLLILKDPLQLKEEEFDQENESEDDEMKSDEEQGMSDTTDQFDDDTDTRLKEPTEIATGIVQGEGNDAEMTEAQQGNVHHEVPRTQAPTLLTIPVSVIPESSPVFTNIPQSSHTFTPTPIQATPTPPPTIETTNPLSNLPDFSSVFRFNDRITALEKEVVDLKKDPLHTQVTSLVDSHLDTRLGETREEFMNFLSESLTARIKEQVKDQLPQILPQEVSNFAPPVIEKLIKESRDEVTLAKVSSQPQSTYEAASTLTEFELKKILLDKIEKSESYLTAPETLRLL